MTVTTYILLGVLVFNGRPVMVSTEFNSPGTCLIAKQTMEKQSTTVLDCFRK